MEETIRQVLLEEYNNILIDMNAKDINKVVLGFISPNKCSSTIFPILIHCIENIEIFTTEQLNNINHFINKISYGG